MKRFSGLDDLRHSSYYPKSAAAFASARKKLLAGFEGQVRELTRAPQAVIESARVLFAFLKDKARRISRDQESLALAALAYLFGADDAIPDSIEFVGYSDDSIILDAVVQELTRALGPTAAGKPAPRKKTARQKK